MCKAFQNAFSLCTLFLCSFALEAQPELVKDINPGGGWSEFEYLFHIGDDFYFLANGDAGREMWISDGTPDGTNLLLDINPGFVSSGLANFVELNGDWYFTADNGVTGTELWKTDGTAGGTNIVVDIHPGFPGADISNLVNINNTLYFQANDGTHGFELWKSDGSAAGTTMVADINVGASSSSPEFMTLMGGNIYFAASDGINGKELWSTDGTSVQMVADVYTGAMSSFPANLTQVGNYIYFTADDGVTGSEVYKSDGTAMGTLLQGDINPGISPSGAADLMAVGNYLFLTADDGTNGIELWRSDALSATPDLQMMELFAGAFSSTPTNFIYLNDDVLFNANDGVHGFELWKANAVDGSLSLVKNISVGFNSSFPVPLDELNGEVIFSAKDSALGIELWKTDGSEAGTVLLGDLNPTPTDAMSDSNPVLPFKQDGILYFTATDNTNGWQIWRTDGTMSATQRLTDIPHDTIFNNTYKPYAVNALSNTIINFVGLGDPYGEELWKYSLNPISIATVNTNSPLMCAGDTNGSLEVTVSGGVGDPACFSYDWNDPAISGLSATDLAAGDYILTVTDCVGFTVTTTVTIEEPDPMTLMTTLLSNTICFGSSDGSATVEAVGGTEPYSYAWDNGEITATALELAAGGHEVTVTDVNGCSNSTFVLVNQPDEVTVDVTAGPVVCFGGGDGSATAAAGGGDGMYTYQWDNGETTATATALTGGEHFVTATDGQGCTGVAVVIVNTSDEIIIDFDSQNVACAGADNGSATAIPSGGSGGGFSFLWENSMTTATISGLSVGSYAVTITDSNGCTNESAISIEGPLASTTVLSGVSCFGESDGQAEVVVTGGAASYNYEWDNGEMTAVATMLSAGSHSVTVSDGATCSFVETVMIDDVALFLVSDLAPTSPTCSNTSDGSIFITGTGGTLPYTYTWSTGDVTNEGILTDLPGDVEYCVTVTDANNCGEWVSCTTLVNPAAITVNFDDTFGTACSDFCDGSSTAIPTGGSPGDVYTFNWSSGEAASGVATHTAFLLCPGENFVTITDGSCSIVESVFVDSPDALQIDGTTTDVSCFGLSDGTITVIVTGGTPPYTFTGPMSDLPAGSYSVTATDANGCSMTLDDIIINQPDEIVIEAFANDVTCFGGSDGSIFISIEGGTAPYTISGDSDGLPVGSYSITVTDAIGCSAVETGIVISGPDEITATTSSTPEMTGNDGTATVSPGGGVGGYTYAWDTNPVQTTATATGLSAGDYTCTITDDNGCSITVTVTVDMLDAIGELSALQRFDLSPNPAHTQLTISIEMDVVDDIRLEMFDAIGKLLSSKTINKVQQQTETIDVSSLQQGVYWLRLTTSEGQLAKRVMVIH